MFCGISGKPTRVPVLSPISKCVFEKDLIEQYVQEEGKDPITNGPLAIDQLIEVSMTPQQASLTNTLNSSTLNSNYSIPNLLSSLQNEWDALMLENFRLRKQLDLCTKQLSTAFYERDAAKIVAAKALKEREQILSEMNKLTELLGSAVENENESESESENENENENGNGNEERNSPTQNLSDIIRESLLKDSREYMEKTRKPSDMLVMQDDIKFELKNNWEIADESITNRTTMLLTHPSRSSIFQTSRPGTFIILKNTGTFQEVRTSLTDDFEYLSLAASLNHLLYSTKEGSIGVYDMEHDLSVQLQVPHDKIIFMAQHEYILKDYFLTVDQKGRAYLSSVNCSNVHEILSGDSEKEYHQAALHKDGLLIALVQKNSVELFNLSEPNDPPTVFQVGKQILADGIIESVEFSSNGYWMIISCGGSIMSFDLRKEAGTLAVNPLNILDAHGSHREWDMDLSGKNILVVDNGSVEDNDIKLLRYIYKKTKKIWEPVAGPTGNLSLNGVQNTSSLLQIQLFYDGKVTSVAIRTASQISLYSTE